LYTVGRLNSNVRAISLIEVPAPCSLLAAVLSQVSVGPRAGFATAYALARCLGGGLAGSHALGSQFGSNCATAGQHVRQHATRWPWIGRCVLQRNKRYLTISKIGEQRRGPWPFCRADPIASRQLWRFAPVDGGLQLIQPGRSSVFPVNLSR